MAKAKTRAPRPDTWMPFYIGDYLADTMHLTTRQHGGYVLLILACWKSGGTLPAVDTSLAAIAKLGAKEWKEDGPTLLAFFKKQSGLLSHKRITEELNRAKELTEKRSKAGANGAAHRWQPDGNGIANGWQDDGPSPSPEEAPLGLPPDENQTPRLAAEGALPQGARPAITIAAKRMPT